MKNVTYNVEPLVSFTKELSEITLTVKMDAPLFAGIAHELNLLNILHPDTIVTSESPKDC